MSVITSDMKWVPSAVMIFVGKYARCVMMSTRARAMVLASIRVTQYVKRYRENSSMTVTIDGSSNRTMSIRNASSGPIASLEVLIIGGVSSLWSVLGFVPLGLWPTSVHRKVL